MPRFVGDTQGSLPAIYSELRDSGSYSWTFIGTKYYSTIFGNRKMIDINFADLVCGLGTIHCITQQ